MIKKVKIKKHLDEYIKAIATREGIDYNEVLDHILNLGIEKYIEKIKEEMVYRIITNKKEGDKDKEA